MKKYMILFTTQDEWGKKEVEAETPLSALEEVYGAPLPGARLEEDAIPSNNTINFLWEEEDTNEFFTGIIVPVESLTEYVYIFKHDSEELVGFGSLLDCYKEVVKDLRKNYGLDEAREIMNFLVDNTDNVLNIELESWGDTTIFIID